MLALRDTWKSFGDAAAVRGVDLDLVPGQTLALIGPSGSGKSTLLRLLMGLIAPDRGEVRLGGEPLPVRGGREQRRRLGYVVQDGGLFPHLTARGNLALPVRHAGWDAGRIDERVRELCELTSFPAGALGRWPAQLSGGMRQRVGLMRALMLDPLVLLLDEPLAALDPLIRAELQRDLRRIFRRLGKTVVLVTHDLAEARYFADRLVLIHDGRIAQDGTYDDLAGAPADDFVRRFLGAQRLLHGGEEEASG